VIFSLFRFSLVLCKGKEEIERTNSLIVGSNSSISASPSLHRRLAQTDADTKLVSDTVTESDILTTVAETQNTAEELQEKAKVCSQNISLLFEPFN
jgi:hypothetical protein